VAVKTLEALITAKDATKAGVDSAKKNLGGLSSAVSGLGPTIAALGPMIGVAFGTAAIKQSIDAFIRQEQAVFQLEQRLKSTGGTSGKTSEELQRLASELQAVTTYGDEAVVEMQALLLTFTNIQGQTFDEATKTVLDLSTAMGQDLKTSAVQLGKALNDPIAGLTSLSRIGVKFTEEQKKLIEQMMKTGDIAGAQKIILQELKVEFGGAAQAASQGLGGALQQMQNAVGDTAESLGKTLAPALIQVAGGIKEAAEAATALNESFLGGISVASQWAAALSVGDISFWEWATSGKEEARKRLEQINLGRDQQSGQLALDTANMPPVPPEIAQQEQYLKQQAEARAAAERTAAMARQEAITKTIAAMKLEAETAGMSAREATLYKLTIQGATDAQVAYADALLRTAEAQKFSTEAANFGQDMFENERALRSTEFTAPADNFLGGFSLSGPVQQTSPLSLFGIPAEDEVLAAFDTISTGLFDRRTAMAEMFGEAFAENDVLFGIGGQQAIDDKLTLYDEGWALKFEVDQSWYEASAEMSGEYRDRALADEQALAEAKRGVWANSANAFMQFTNALYTISGSSSKKLFTLNKAAGIASATINTYDAVNAALKNPPGPPWTYPIAAAVGAMGLANVASIASTSFGGGGGPAPAGGTGGGTTTSPIITQPVSQEPIPTSREINIVIYGNVVDHDKFARELVPSITKAIGDGVQ